MRELYGDFYVKNKKGIFEYILGVSNDTKLLEIRGFDEVTKKDVYSKQTDAAKIKGESNCPYCAIGHDANKSKIWKLGDMDADHVNAWSKGGATILKNCEMLCKPTQSGKRESVMRIIRGDLDVFGKWFGFQSISNDLRHITSSVTIRPKKWVLSLHKS